jgi:hypothetical protein
LPAIPVTDVLIHTKCGNLDVVVLQLYYDCQNQPIHHILICEIAGEVLTMVNAAVDVFVLLIREPLILSVHRLICPTPFLRARSVELGTQFLHDA